MPILSQSQIQNETRSRWAGTTNRIMQGLLRQSLADFETFINGAIGLLDVPTSTIKSISSPEKCCHHSTDKAYTPSQISSLERKFRDLFGQSKAVDLLNMAQRWSLAAFSSEQVGMNGYWGTAYFTLVNHQLRATYDESRTAWDALRLSLRRQIAPPIPVVVDNSTDFMEEIYNQGYKRVTDKITKLHLNQIREIMVDGMNNGKTPQEIASDLNALGGREAYHWTRLVRSEMINASQEAAIEAAKESEGINMKWITAISNNTCNVCRERNGMVFDPAKMGMPSYFKTTETAKISVPVGRYPHPQCRCSLSPTYRPVTWNP